MTITERNQALYQLRKDLAEAQARVEWFKHQIVAVREEYRRGVDTPLFEEMFGG